MTGQLKMSDQPINIWCGKPYSGSIDGAVYYPGAKAGYTEYVRKDIHDQIVAQRNEILEALNKLGSMEAFTNSFSLSKNSPADKELASRIKFVHDFLDEIRRKDYSFKAAISQAEPKAEKL